MIIKRNMKLDLIKTAPSGYPISKLKDQLTALNLVCDETDEEQLKEYKREVMANLRSGNQQIYGMMKSLGNRQVKSNLLCNSNGFPTGLKGEVFFGALGAEKLEETGSWILKDDVGGYREELCTLIFPSHFDKLFNGHVGFFNGTRKEEHWFINEFTGPEIRDMFIRMATSITNIIPGGISMDDLETMVSVILGDNESAYISDYEINDYLNVFMVNGYDERSGEARSVGGLSIQYKIRIKDYMDKGDNKDGRYNDAIIDMTARFASYSDLEIMKRDLNWLP